jgi:hypothetical protein
MSAPRRNTASQRGTGRQTRLTGMVGRVGMARPPAHRRRLVHGAQAQGHESREGHGTGFNTA